MFNTGDVVRLKSWDNEGTKMTVEAPATENYYGKIACVWFDKTGNVHRGTFKPDSLTKIC